MKRILSIITSVLVVANLLVGCNNTKSINSQTQESHSNDISEKKLNIVTTIFPQYDFTRQITKDKANVTMLLKPGMETHSFDPTPQDIKSIQNADLFIYTGGENDVWIDNILSSMKDKRPDTIKLIDCVNTVNEEIVEGMEHEHEHEHNDDFEDSDVKDRTLNDWKGDWQSAYPHLLKGELDEVFHHKAEENEDKTEKEYKEIYTKGFKTDIERIKIEDDKIYFYTDGQETSSKYAYKGYTILTKENGKKSVRYQFEATDKDTKAPKYVQFSDHEISPKENPEHFHIYVGNDSFNILSNEFDNWPTYFSSKLTGKEIAENMLGHSHSHEHEEIDEHVWTSPVNAIKIVEKIADVLMEKDPYNKESYQNNSAKYIDELKELNDSFRKTVSNTSQKTIIFADRFPFRYFADEYGLEYYAAFSGCSTSTDASPSTVAFLIDKVQTEKIPVVFTIEFSNEKIADSVCEATNAKKAMFHSCHNVSADEMKNGATYLSLMQNNIKLLQEALS